MRRMGKIEKGGGGGEPELYIILLIANIFVVDSEVHI